jgi:hypothetical protein
MSRVKIVMLGLLAVFAVGASASATASATSTHQWIIEGTSLGSTSKAEVQGNGLPHIQEGQIESSIAGLGLHIYCQTTILPSGASNVLEGGTVGKIKSKIEFTGCSIFDVTSKGASEHLATCKIETEPIVAEAEGELTGAGVLTLKGLSGGAIAKFNLVKANKEASCAAETKTEVKGSQVCVFPHDGVEAYTHVLECLPGGSSLTLSGEPARLYLGAGITRVKGCWSET